MERTGLFDRDVCLKLAWCGLWDEALAALGITRAFRLASCTAGPSNRKVLLRKIGEGEVLDRAMDRLAAMVAATPVIPDGLVGSSRSSAVLVDVDGIPDIDPGEALLLAIIAQASDPTILISGDKRFFGALRQQRPRLWAVVAGKLLSFEGCLNAIVAAQGPAFVIERVRPVGACDSTLQIALGSGPVCDVLSFTDALSSFDPLR